MVILSEGDGEGKGEDEGDYIRARGRALSASWVVHCEVAMTVCKAWVHWKRYAVRRGWQTCARACGEGKKADMRVCLCLPLRKHMALCGYMRVCMR